MCDTLKCSYWRMTALTWERHPWGKTRLATCDRPLEGAFIFYYFHYFLIVFVHAHVLMCVSVCTCACMCVYVCHICRCTCAWHMNMFTCHGMYMEARGMEARGNFQKHQCSPSTKVSRDWALVISLTQHMFFCLLSPFYASPLAHDKEQFFLWTRSTG